MSYRYMRLLLMFDMPTDTASDRKAYRKFRKFLINEGFIMHQFSVYSKILLNDTANKQFSRMIYLHGEQDNRVANSDERIVFLGEE